MLTRAFSTTALLLLFACNAPGTTDTPKPFTPGLSLRPLAVSLTVGATQAFQAEINYPEGARYLRQPVVWRVVEPTGGTISGAGLYTAPAQPGVYHVEVRREDFPELSATATVTVK